MSDGDTPRDAVRNLQDARELYIESLLDDGLDVPLPKTVVTPTTSSTTGSWYGTEAWNVRSVRVFKTNLRAEPREDDPGLEELEEEGLEVGAARAYLVAS